MADRTTLRYLPYGSTGRQRRYTLRRDCDLGAYGRAFQAVQGLCAVLEDISQREGSRKSLQFLVLSEHRSRSIRLTRLTTSDGTPRAEKQFPSDDLLLRRHAAHELLRMAGVLTGRGLGASFH